MEARGVPLKDDAPMPLAKGGDAELERGHLLVRVTVRFGFGFGFGFGIGSGSGSGIRVRIKGPGKSWGSLEGG